MLDKETTLTLFCRLAQLFYNLMGTHKTADSEGHQLAATLESRQEHNILTALANCILRTTTSPGCYSENYMFFVMTTATKWPVTGLCDFPKLF